MEKINFKGWKCYKLTAAGVSLIVAPEIGGRIISLDFEGDEFLFVQQEHEGDTFDFSKVETLRAEKRKMGFRVWGGDKTWVAPQKDWWEGIPPLELDAGQYEVRLEGNGFMMTSPVCRETGLQITRRVNLDKDGTIHLRQVLTNKSKFQVHKGIWNVTQLLRPADVYLPTVKANLRSYHEEDLTLPHHNVVVNEIDGWCQIPCRDNTLFKFGGVLDIGTMIAVRSSKDSTLALLKNFSLEEDAQYAHQSKVEVFNALDHNYLEIEIHGSIVKLDPGDQCSHEQTWRLKRFAGTPSINDIYENLTGKNYQKAAQKE